MNILLQANSPQYRDAVFRYITEQQLGFAEGLREEGALLGQTLIALTPPRTKAQGRKAVARDIKRAIRPLTPKDFPNSETDRGLNKRLRNYIRERNYSALEDVFAKVKGNEFYKWKVVEFDAQWHRAARVSRGRVVSQHKVATPDADKVTAYITGVQGGVGRGKGGWAEGTIQLGGRVPGWVAEHRGQGTFEDKASNPVKAYIRFVNNSEWAEGGDDDRIVENAIQSRTKKIISKLEAKQAHAKHRAKLF